MTGRRLYDLYCDAHHEKEWRSESLPAWPWLTGAQKAKWNALVRRLKGVKR